MGASIFAYWPGITDEQIESQPGFANDDHDWATWMAEGLTEPDVVAVLERMGTLPLATMTTEGVSDEEVYWVTPAELRKAADRLCRLIDEEDAEAAALVERYELTAYPSTDTAGQFQQDLRDIESLAAWAGEQGAEKLTLHVSW
jgi:hypothetical protein